MIITKENFVFIDRGAGSGEKKGSGLPREVL